jgi:hypothetical protein
MSNKEYSMTTTETETETVVLSKWRELKTLVATLETDVTKNASGNAAAGVRARKGLRELKQTTSDLVKLTLGKEV